jgi:hypothetical protein
MVNKLFSDEAPLYGTVDSEYLNCGVVKSPAARTANSNGVKAAD